MCKNAKTFKAVFCIIVYVILVVYSITFKLG